MKKSALALAVILSLAFLCTGCLGPNHLHDSIRNWNAEVSGQDWINEAIFIGLTVFPVYGLAYLGDILIFNTIDYWSGDNPISDPGLFPHNQFTATD